MKSAIKIISVLVVLFSCIILTSCGKDKLEEYHLERKYWNTEDYARALRIIKFDTPKEEKYPCYSTPELVPVFKKLIDTNNFIVVLNDTTLGISHRSEFSSELFESYREMTNIYSTTDQQDKFIYPNELVDIMQFGLNLQIFYFKQGNEKIMNEADGPSDTYATGTVRMNENTLIGNYNIYLDFINQENAFSTEALENYATGIDKYFKRLLLEFPNADYSEMVTKTDLMLKKAQSKKIIDSLTNLMLLLKEKTDPKPLTGQENEKTIGIF